MSVNGHRADNTYWAAYLAAAIADALLHWGHARETLTKALGRFAKSKACSPELRAILKGEK